MNHPEKKNCVRLDKCEFKNIMHDKAEVITCRAPG